MLTAQSLKITTLLKTLREQGFDTSAIERQEKEIARSLSHRGEMVGERLKLRAQQQQLSQQITEATADVAEMARGQASNAATSAGATQASIYDLIESHQGQAAEHALDRLIDIDLEYYNQMNELRLSALRVQQMVMNTGNNRAQNNTAALENQLNAAVRVLQRRQLRIEDPVVRIQVTNTVNTISRYVELLSCIAGIMTSRPNCRSYRRIISSNLPVSVAKSASWWKPSASVIKVDWRISNRPASAGNTCFCC